MTLYPWPQPNDAPSAGHLVVWKRGTSAARSLLIDSLAVPLRFVDSPDDARELPVVVTATQNSISARDAGLQRVRHIEQLLAVQDFKLR
jgi:hypothetical protein